LAGAGARRIQNPHRHSSFEKEGSKKKSEPNAQTNRFKSSKRRAEKKEGKRRARKSGMAIAPLARKKKGGVFKISPSWPPMGMAHSIRFSGADIDLSNNLLIGDISRPAHDSSRGQSPHRRSMNGAHPRAGPRAEPARSQS
jgi:hypothetical protein